MNFQSLRNPAQFSDRNRRVFLPALNTSDMQPDGGARVEVTSIEDTGQKHL
jgi:hypothetical protein